ncbi:unnamed protein product, partial [Meganyctiphanes norvegica]
MYPYKSGAQKKKEKKEREEKEKIGQQTLFQLGLTLASKELKELEQVESVKILTSKQDSDDLNIPAEDSKDEVDAEENERQKQNDTFVDLISKQEVVGVDNFEQDDDAGADLVNENIKHLETGSQMHWDINVKDKVRNDVGLDIGCITTKNISQKEIERYVTIGHIPLPQRFPKDAFKRKFPESILKSQIPNGEIHARDWLVWSQKKQALYCFPCRLFWYKIVKNSNSDPDSYLVSTLVSAEGWGVNVRWQKLYLRIPSHERGNPHKKCYLAWRELERRLVSGTGVNVILESSIKSEALKWYNILMRIIDVVLFLGERGLAFQGVSNKIGDSNNGNFLGL